MDLSENDQEPQSYRHDGTSPLPLGLEWSPNPSSFSGNLVSTRWPGVPPGFWAFRVSIPSWVSVNPPAVPGMDPFTKPSPVVLYRVELTIRSPRETLSRLRILRRFSDFLKFHASLQKEMPGKAIPDPPPRHRLLFVSSNNTLISQRRVALEHWMHEILEDLELSRTPAVAAFLELSEAARGAALAMEAESEKGRDFDSEDASAAGGEGSSITASDGEGLSSRVLEAYLAKNQSASMMASDMRSVASSGLPSPSPPSSLYRAHSGESLASVSGPPDCDISDPHVPFSRENLPSGDTDSFTNNEDNTRDGGTSIIGEEAQAVKGAGVKRGSSGRRRRGSLGSMKDADVARDSVFVDVAGNADVAGRGLDVDKSDPLGASSEASTSTGGRQDLVLHSNRTLDSNESGELQAPPHSTAQDEQHLNDEQQQQLQAHPDSLPNQEYSFSSQQHVPETSRTGADFGPGTQSPPEASMDLSASMLVLPESSRPVVLRHLAVLQRRLHGAQADVEAMGERMQREAAVSHFLSRKVTDLEAELDSARRQLAQSVSEREERLVALEWGVEGERGKLAEAEERAARGEARGKELEADLAALRQEKEELEKQHLESRERAGSAESVKRKEMETLRAAFEKEKAEETAKLRGEVKALAREVKALRKTQKESEENTARAREQTARQEALILQALRWSSLLRQRKEQVLHEVEVLGKRLQETSVSSIAGASPGAPREHAGESQGVLSPSPRGNNHAGQLTEQLEVLSTSDARIDVILAEARLLQELPDWSYAAVSDELAKGEVPKKPVSPQQNGNPKSSPPDSGVPVEDIEGSTVSEEESERSRVKDLTTDREVAYAMVKLLIDASNQRKSVNALIRHAYASAL